MKRPRDTVDVALGKRCSGVAMILCVQPHSVNQIDLRRPDEERTSSHDGHVCRDFHIVDTFAGVERMKDSQQLMYPNGEQAFNRWRVMKRSQGIETLRIQLHDTQRCAVDEGGLRHWIGPGQTRHELRSLTHQDFDADLIFQEIVAFVWTKEAV